jgi:hypothetical protein
MARTLVLLFVGCILAVVSIAVHVGDVKPKTSNAKAKATAGKKTKSKVRSPEQGAECTKCLCKATKNEKGDILQDGGEEDGMNCKECQDLTVGEFNDEQKKLRSLYKCTSKALDQDALNMCGTDFEKEDKKNGVCSGEPAKGIGDCTDCLCSKTRDWKGHIRSDAGRRHAQLHCGVCLSLKMSEFNKEQEKFKALYECTDKASNDEEELDACGKEFDAGDVCTKEQLAAGAATNADAGGAAAEGQGQAGGDQGSDATSKGKKDNDNGGGDKSGEAS